MTALIPWSAAELAAIDTLRGTARGSIVTQELLNDADEATTQTTVLTEHGAVVLMSWVPDAEITESRHVFVRQHVNRIRRRLNLPAVTVRYFGPPRWAEDSEILVHEVNRAHPAFEVQAEERWQRAIAGVTSRSLPWTISLHVSLTGDDLIWTIAHELRHVDQIWGRAIVPEAEREQDAEAFAAAWMAAR